MMSSFIFKADPVQAESFLALIDPPRRCHQHGVLDVVVGCAEVFEDDMAPAATLSELDLDAARAARTRRTNTTSRTYRGPECVNQRPRNALTCTGTLEFHRIAIKWHESVRGRLPW